MKLIDTHAHLDYFDNVHEIVESAKQNDVDKIITISTKLRNIDKLAGFAKAHEGVYYTAAQHPCDPELSASECYDTMDVYLSKVSKEAKFGKLVAIGETGLDVNGPAHQMDIFQAHIDIARKYALPLVIHSRDIDVQLLHVLKSNRDVTGVLHCWTGALTTSVQAVELGWYVSFSGILTFRKKVEYLWEQAQTLPLHRILVETDAPYLAPHPLRGQRNQPAHVKLTAQWLAELRCMPFETCAEQLYKNAHDLFDL